MKPNDYEKLVEDLKKRKLYEPPSGGGGGGEQMLLDEVKIQKPVQKDNRGGSGGNYKTLNRIHDNNNRNKFQKDANKTDSLLFKPRYDEYDDYEKDFSSSK